jgi:23S rRNA (uracil1939-C5)-methyltransferase
LTDAEWAAEAFLRYSWTHRVTAFRGVRKLATLGAKRLVYVLQPGDAGARHGRVVKQGYRLKRAGILDMFPQTAHVEAMALFEAG